jgi:hypothetical protein
MRLFPQESQASPAETSEADAGPHVSASTEGLQGMEQAACRTEFPSPASGRSPRVSVGPGPAQVERGGGQQGSVMKGTDSEVAAGDRTLKLEKEVSTLTAQNKLLKEQLSAVSPGLEQAEGWAKEAVKGLEESEAVREVRHAS